MAQGPDASKQRRWLALIRLWQRSQLSVREFCQRRQLSEPCFYAWRRALRQRGLLHDLPPHQPVHSTPAPAFVKLTVDPQPTTPSIIELVLNGRRLLRVPPGFDPAMLLQLVRLLEEPPC